MVKGTLHGSEDKHSQATLNQGDHPGSFKWTYIVTVTLQVDKEGERRIGVRKIPCKKGSAAIAGFEEEREGHKPRNRNSFESLGKLRK